MLVFDLQQYVSLLNSTELNISSSLSVLNQVTLQRDFNALFELDQALLLIELRASIHVYCGNGPVFALI